MHLVTAEQMRALDRRTIQLGTPGLVLMERAGAGIAKRIAKRLAAECRRGVLVVAGPGNNGGDGFVIARHLRRTRHRVVVALLGRREELKGDARTNQERWGKAGGRILELRDDPEPVLRRAARGSGLVVDAIFGTGLAREVRGPVATTIRTLNEVAGGRERPLVAVDVPSGLDSDTGLPLGVAIRADFTLTLGAVKLGLVLPVARAHVGALEMVEIGLAEEAWARIGPVAEAGDAATLGGRLPRRDVADHKGTHGHLLIVGGAPGKTGAAVLAGRAALRGGAGLVTVACPRAAQPLIAGGAPELMTEGFGPFVAAGWRRLLVGKAALVVGPGMGVSPPARRLVRWLVARAERPLVLDADGINAIAGASDVLAQAAGKAILTPHPGEMSRLTGYAVQDVQSNRRSVSLELAGRTGCVVVLKGSGTLIAAPDGRLTVNTTGGPLLGTGGTGDVLAGLIGSLLAQKLEPYDAARVGVFLHGLAADRLAGELGDAGLLASDLADELPRARRDLVAARSTS